MTSSDAFDAMNSFSKVIPTDSSFIRKVISSRYNTLVDSCHNNFGKVGSISRCTNLIENNAHFCFLFSKFDHGFYKVITKCGVEPCRTDNHGFLANFTDSCLAYKLCFAVHAIWTWCIGLYIRRWVPSNT